MKMMGEKKLYIRSVYNGYIYIHTWKYCNNFLIETIFSNKYSRYKFNLT